MSREEAKATLDIFFNFVKVQLNKTDRKVFLEGASYNDKKKI